jgi:hypothetical protein
MSKPEHYRGIRFLWTKGKRASKTAFWQFMIMVAVVAFIYMVVIRLAWLPDKMFVEALIQAEAFLAIITLIVSWLYHSGKENGNNGR